MTDNVYNITESPTIAPPYIPWGAFKSFISDLSENGLPSRIDSSIMDKVNRQYRATLIQTLKFLGLIDDTSKPTEIFSSYIQAKNDEKREILKGIILAAYPFLNDNSVDLSRTTGDELRQHFEQQGVNGNTVTRCIAFLIQACYEAQIDVSPHLRKRTRMATPKKKNTGYRVKKRNIPSQPKLPAQQHTKSGSETQTDIYRGKTWNEMLIEKFPQFDPSWDESTRKEWFQAYQKLIELFKSEFKPRELPLK